MSGLRLEWLTVERGGRRLLDPLDARFEPGTLLGLVGPNGSGKSSLLSAIARTGVRTTGTVRFAGDPLDRLSARARARTVSFMSQDAQAPNELRVLDVVGVGASAGRVPGRITERSMAALDQLGVAHLAHRSYATLSGGERQCVQVARVLAQDTPVMLLDEPTSALDLHHQLTVMHVLAERAAAGRVVLVTLHDIGLALRWATEVAVLPGDGSATIGDPHAVLTPELIRRVYGVTAEVFRSPAGSPSLALVRASCPTARALTPRHAHQSPRTSIGRSS